MADLDTIVLAPLRPVVCAIDGGCDDFGDIKQRIANLENPYASMSNRLDRIDVRIEPIERRLDLGDA